MAIQAKFAVMGGLVGDRGSPMRVVAGDATQRGGFGVAAAEHHLFGMAHDFHFLARIGGPVIVLKIFQRQAGTIVGQASATGIDVRL